MPTYEYQCARGHLTEKFRRMDDRHPKAVKCDSCGRRAARIFSATAVRDDFPEHYNWSFGCVVKNRAHHRQLQQAHGVQDWEPVKEGPLTSKLRKEGAI